VPSILIVEDDRTVRRALTDRLGEAGYQVHAAEGIDAGRNVLAETKLDAALFDIRLKDGDGLELLDEVRAALPHLPVIMVTAFGDSDRTIRAMKAGAFDYVTKPFELDALLAILERAVRVQSAAPVTQPATATPLVGASPAMLGVWKAIGRAAASRVPVLVTGESGTGKELVARAIHDHAHRERPFVAVNVAALPPSLVETELFGHEKGAFTGAVARREGRFELAANGTLFLDEIADLELPLQTKLLRVLEDHGYERVGGAARLESAARIISATSRNVAPRPGNLLREDLYYRLAVLRIDVPPLRERREDIPVLVHTFLSRTGQPREISRSAMSRLMEYGWPGNVRQLRHVLENACVMSTRATLETEDFELPMSEEARAAAAAPKPETPRTNLDLRENLEALERDLILTALERAQGNRAEAARLLGIRRALLYARITHLGLTP
jgi:two-component system response regulator AtoC